MAFKTEPYPYQLEVFEKSKDLVGAAYFLEQGLGKSKILIDVACHLAKQGIIKAVIVFAPMQVATNWALGEIETHAWDGLNHDVFRRVKSERATVALCSKALAKSPAENTLWWFCTNKEGLLDKAFNTELREFMRRVPTLLVLDESTFIKTPSSKTSRAAINLGKFAKVRRVLTGTPQTNSPIDLYPQYTFLSSLILGITTKSAFEDYYCQMEKRYFGPKKFAFDAVGLTDSFHSRVAPYTFRYKKVDVLDDLPPKQYQTFKVSLSDREAKTYAELRKHMVTTLKHLEQEGEIQTFNKLAQVIRLQQLLSGIAVHTEGLHFFESSKQLAAKEIIESTDRPLLIFANFRYSIETLVKLAKAAGKRVGWLYGGMKQDVKDGYQEAFKRGDLDVLVCHPKSAGKGLTFVNCSTVLFYENSYNWEDRVQAEDRIHRIGQKADSCQYIDLIVADSIDERIQEVLNLKSNLNDVLKKEDLAKWL